MDDSPGVRTLLRRILEELGFEVTEAGDGREGLELLRKEPGARPFDLAMADWRMPALDGPSFVRAVRAEPALSGVRVVMVSGESRLERIAAALEAGADEYVMKPFTREAVAEKLALLGLALP